MSESEDLVRKYINIIHPSSSWNRVYCAVCGDGTHEKGPRGGWKFSGDMAAYHCFNCGVKGTLDFTREFPLSKEMSKILEAFGVDKKDYLPLLFKDKTKEYVKPKFKLNVATIELPDLFVPLEQAPPDKLEMALQVLDDHCMSITDYPFYFSMPPLHNQIEDFSDEIYYRSIANRLIVPAYSRSQVIYYEARILIDKKDAPKYISSKGGSKSDSCYFMDRIYEKTTAPLYITEGFFDAWHINGIATMRNDISSNMIELLNSIDRPKVVVPDRGGDSNKLAEVAVANGWGISILRYSNCKDISENVKKYGKLLTSKTLYESIAYGNKAKLMMRFL